MVEGRLQLDQWEDRNGGGQRSKLRVVADQIQFMNRRQAGDNQGYAPRQNGPQPNQDYGSANAPYSQSAPSYNQSAPYVQNNYGNDYNRASRAMQQDTAPQMPEADFSSNAPVDDDIPF